MLLVLVVCIGDSRACVGMPTQAAGWGGGEKGYLCGGGHVVACLSLVDVSWWDVCVVLPARNARTGGLQGLEAEALQLKCGVDGQQCVAGGAEAHGPGDQKPRQAHLEQQDSSTEEACQPIHGLHTQCLRL